MVFCEKLQQLFVKEMVSKSHGKQNLTQKKVTQYLHSSTSPSCVINPILSSTLEDLKAAMAWTMGSHIFSLMFTCHHIRVIITDQVYSPLRRTSPPRRPHTCRAQTQAGADSGPPHTRGSAQHWWSFQLRFLELCKIEQASTWHYYWHHPIALWSYPLCPSIWSSCSQRTTSPWVSASWCPGPAEVTRSGWWLGSRPW